MKRSVEIPYGLTVFLRSRLDFFYVKAKFIVHFRTIGTSAYIALLCYREFHDFDKFRKVLNLTIGH